MQNTTPVRARQRHGDIDTLLRSGGGSHASSAPLQPGLQLAMIMMDIQRQLAHLLLHITRSTCSAHAAGCCWPLRVRLVARSGDGGCRWRMHGAHHLHLVGSLLVCGAAADAWRGGAARFLGPAAVAVMHCQRSACCPKQHTGGANANCRTPRRTLCTVAVR